MNFGAVLGVVRPKTVTFCRFSMYVFYGTKCFSPLCHPGDSNSAQSEVVCSSFGVYV